ncbi:tetracycline resistance protein [Geomicrobium sp. JCM 19037]|uniref:MFS transporter n=1 Tax=Geomicrobium sp. JCM 19037 TaxID=1460634 RepID=UPI00045F1127|nr:MFS transporter [Geomicrobium sp. JCM 19037]GAK02201.1 tetracycline resistance protein [Geomicrobium sp. JCM 19037]
MKQNDPVIQSYIQSKEKQRQLYKRTLFIVSFSQVFGGAGLAAGITVGALLAQEMLQTEALAGLPAALFTLGSALAAFLVGRLSQRFGRRTGLFLGFFAGAVGAFGVVLAAVLGSAFLLFLSLFVYGAGTSTNLQARYAGTDLASEKQRGKAVSIAMVSTTFGAVAGPNLVDLLGDFALSIGVPALAGPFILAGVAFLLAGLVLFILLRPDPFLIAQALAAETSGAETEDEQSAPKTLHRGIITGALIMILTQLVMVAIMTMTPVHMEHHGHHMGAIGLVIGIHVGAMYLPSLFTGYLVDRYGRISMAVAAGVTLLGAGLIGGFGSGDDLTVLIVSLALLGIGWNLGLISGTSLIVDNTTTANRAKTQGSVDVFIALAGATGGAMSGMVVAGASYTALSLFGGVLSLVLIPIVYWYRKKG